MPERCNCFDFGSKMTFCAGNVKTENNMQAFLNTVAPDLRSHDLRDKVRTKKKPPRNAGWLS